MSDQKILFLSIPFWRVAKVFLNPLLLQNLSRGGAKIVVITPLDITEIQTEFSKTYPFDVIKFNPLLKGRFASILYSISELLRLNGYWFKFRKTEMKYYEKNMYREFRETGDDVDKPIHNRLLIFILSTLGSLKLWDKFDYFLWKTFVYPDKLKAYLASISNVALIQSASWGLQDRALASWARTNRVSGFLLPYTTDQIIMNGFLLMDYKKIFLQGPVERFFAEKMQECDLNSLYDAGSLWLRNIDQIVKTNSKAKVEGREKFKIVYAGVAPLYYPRIAELDTIQFISTFLSTNYKNVDIDFIYRPYIAGENEKPQIISKIERLNNVTLQWPKYLINNLSGASVDAFTEDIRVEVGNLIGVDIFIMSISTSLAIDVSYVSRSAVISNMIDYDEVLFRRHTKELVKNETLRFVPGAKVVYSLEALQNAVATILNSGVDKTESASQILSNWDYNNPDFPNNISNLLDIS